MKPAWQPNFHTQPMDTWTLTLNRYQRDNLLLLLNVIGYPNPNGIEPFNIMNTGDWVGEIVIALGKHQDSGLHGQAVIKIDADDQPNTTVDIVRDRVELWLQQELAKRSTDG